MDMPETGNVCYWVGSWTGKATKHFYFLHKADDSYDIERNFSIPLLNETEESEKKYDNKLRIQDAH